MSIYILTRWKVLDPFLSIRVIVDDQFNARIVDFIRILALQNARRRLGVVVVVAKA